MPQFNVILERALGPGAGIAAQQTGAKDFATNFDKSAFPGLPFGLANLPNPFIRLDKTIADGVAVQGRPVVDRPVAISRLRLDGLELPNLIVEVSGRKNVISTKIAGKDDVVNEIVSFEMWAVKLRGYVIGPTTGTPDSEFGYFPYTELKKQVKLFRKNQALQVECEYFRLLDIHYLILTDVNFPDMAGYDNVFAYEFNAISDKPVELVIKR
jgi:hypothetical protein